MSKSTARPAMMPITAVRDSFMLIDTPSPFSSFLSSGSGIGLGSTEGPWLGPEGLEGGMKEGVTLGAMKGPDGVKVGSMTGGLMIELDDILLEW